MAKFCFTETDRKAIVAREKARTEREIPTKKVAWCVREEYEGHSVIVFHSSGIAAKKIGVMQIDCEFDDAECRREPKYDEFAESGGEVPILRLLDDGWWFECHHCDRRISDDEEDIRLKDVLEIGRSVYCGQLCKDNHDHKVKQCNDNFEKFKQQIVKLRPDLEFTSFEGGYPYITMSAKFKFPDAKYRGSVRSKDNVLTWYVANADQDAWKQYNTTIAEGKRRKG